ncbi:tetratricopeptide repeat protein [Persicimonas caeni]|uniref:Tetratricopeptide repeat protein n=1 Tax=Persicimonas caeni TaxID=2292766 RepID=A0A4Y6PX36_PERCE|nr:serine/threonine-protein kinase [Persicimonas caeni]QDG52315.1 tetratricopeptide repeat protein [Persicimonas caeni]QED33537.1 protein kinase [Persicimonas caeni]
MSDRTPNTPNTPIPPTPDHHRRPNLSTLDHCDTPRGLSNPSSIVHETLGPFEVHESIGRGGMGVVLRGRHLEQQVPVAIKVITGSRSVDAHMRRRLRNEVQAVAALHHPGIVMVFDYGEVGQSTELLREDDVHRGTPYFVMELAQRGTLRDLAGRVHWHQARAILLTLLDALAHAHAAGVIHRDIKPENILLARWNGRLIPKLADFGIAFAVDGGAATSHCIGTPRYMAPEQINQPWRTHGPWSDLYSLGCVAYELLSGMELFQGSDVVKIYQEHFRAEYPRLDSVVPVPPEVQGWLDKMLARDVDDRFQSAAEAAKALAAIDDHGLPDTTPAEVVSFEFAQLTPVLDALLESGSSVESPTKSTLTQLPEQWPPPTVEPMSMRIVGTGLGLYGLRAIPLIGRDAELDRMWRALRDAESTAESRVVVLRGSQGAGKTRLVDWFTQRIKEFGAATIMRATHSAEGGGADGLGLMLARHFRILGTSDQQAERVIREALAKVGIESDYDCQAMVRIARPFLEVGESENSVTIDNPTQRHAVIQRYLQALAEQRPVIIWCDDVQWGSDAIEFARFVRRHSDSTGRVLLILSATDDALAECPEERDLLDILLEQDRVDELLVEPLAPVEHERLVQELLLLEGELAREVVAKTAGNPLFAVELIGDWIEQGVLESGERGFVLREGVEPTIPDHLHQVWVKRFEALLDEHSDYARDALELAAALGQDVQFAEWEGVCDLAGVRLDENLAADLAERRFIRYTEAGFTFAHAIMRESIERLARNHGTWVARRRHCATLVETLYDISMPHHAERFGRYAMSAHEFSRAFEPLVEGARGRRRRGEYRAAQRLLSSSLRCLEQMDAPENDRRWGDVWVIRARTYLNNRQPREAAPWARRAMDAAERHGWTEIYAQAMGWLGMSLQWMGDKAASETIHRACELLTTIDTDAPMRGVFGSVAHVLTSLRNFEAAELMLDRDLEAATREGDELAIAHNHHLRVRHAFFQHKWNQALQYGEETMALCDRLGHLPGKGLCLEIMSEAHRLMGNFERAEDLYRECVALQHTIGVPTAVSETNLAHILLNRGRIQEAERYFTRAANTFADTGRRLFHVVAVAGLLACASAQKLWDAVGEHLDFIRDFFDESDASERDLALLLEFAGDHLRDAGQFRDAVAVYTLAVQQWHGLGDEERVDQVMGKISRWT